MNAEELKIILDAVSAVSGDAKSVLIWYFVGKFGTAILQPLVIMSAILAGVVVVMRGIRAMADDAMKVRAVCNHLGVSNYCDVSDIIEGIERKVRVASK